MVITRHKGSKRSFPSLLPCTAQQGPGWFCCRVTQVGELQMNEVLMDIDEWMDAMVGHDGQGKRLDGRRFELIHLWSWSAQLFVRRINDAWLMLMIERRKYDVGLIPYSVKPRQGHSLWRNGSNVIHIPSIHILNRHKNQNYWPHLFSKYSKKHSSLGSTELLTKIRSLLLD